MNFEASTFERGAEPTKVDLTKCLPALQQKKLDFG